MVQRAPARDSDRCDRGWQVTVPLVVSMMPFGAAHRAMASKPGPRVARGGPPSLVHYLVARGGMKHDHWRYITAEPVPPRFKKPPSLAWRASSTHRLNLQDGSPHGTLGTGVRGPSHRAPAFAP